MDTEMGFKRTGRWKVAANLIFQLAELNTYVGISAEGL